MREMKDSGVEWIGEIPKDWELTQVKYLFKIGRGRVIAQTELTDTGIFPVYSSQTKDNGCLGYIETFDFDLDQLTWTTDGANAGTVFIRNGKHNCTNVCGTLQPMNNNLNLKYQKYALEHIAFYHKRADTNGFKIMNNEMAAIRTIYPPFETQHRIADYLDRKCSKIDEIIEKERQVIEKLKAYKLSVITETVTKGLDPNVPMKDSGVEWIGEIPEGWSTVKLKYCTYIRARLGWKGLKADEYKEEGFPLLSAFNIINSKLVFENLNFISQERYDESPEIKLSLNDVLLVKDGAGIGKCAIVTELPFESTVNGSIAVVTANIILSGKYLYYYFLTSMFQKFIDRLKGGMGVPHLFQSDLKEIQIPLPDQGEQKSISDYLDQKCTQIHETIAKKQSTIEKLTAYKKSLIYEVVTGKKEV